MNIDDYVLVNMLVNKPEKSIFILEKNKNNYKFSSVCHLCNSNYTSSGKVTIIEKGKKNEKDLCKLFHFTYGGNRVWHKNLSETVHGKST